MEVFGRYRLLKRIAEGGMGEIFLARSASIDGFDKDLVIKRIRPEISANEQFVNLFIDEARLSIGMSHANVIQVFDFGQTDGCYYLSMEHVYGCDLTMLLDMDDILGRGLPPGFALFVMREVLKGLDYAHNLKDRDGRPLGLVHRDISPDNVIVSFEGGVKITDFGIAKAAGQVTQMQKGTVVGKWPYMAPEHASGEPVTRLSDVYSCGLVLWELLTGDMLHGGEMDAALHARIIAGQVDKPSSRNRSLHRTLDKLVMRALERDPKDRYQSAREFSNAIHEVLTDKYREVDSYWVASFLEARKSRLGVASFADLWDEGPPAILEGSRTDIAAVPVFEIPPEISRAAQEFRQRPSVWHLVRIGDLCHDAKHSQSALSAYRVSAVKFAQRGLLAQALLAAKRMLDEKNDRDTVREIGRLVELVGKSDASVMPYLFRSGGSVEELIGELIAAAATPTDRTHAPPPLLGALGPEAFGKLAKLAPERVYHPEDAIVRQGEGGRAMYLILTGRTVVYVTREDGSRVNVASLSAGDFFGENGFFSGDPRNATVEAVEPTVVLEIERAIYDQVSAGNPHSDGILLQFYKERIVDSLLATSPTFGLLKAPQRRELLAKFRPRRFRAGEVVLQEGDASREIYVISAGSAQAFSGTGPNRMALSTIGPGSIIGEVAAITGNTRTASVVAGEGLEALELDAREFLLLLEAHPELAEQIKRVARERLSSLPPKGPVARRRPW